MLFVANWKMQKTLDQSIQFVQKHIDALKALNRQIILCPSFPALYPLSQLLENSSVFLGAQDCSPHELGAYTGQVSAQSLAEVGCTYCIVGHSERRNYNKESNSEIAQKATQLLHQNIIPIVCVGESQQEFEKKQSIDVLHNQLEPVFKVIESQSSASTVCIAYEPIWSIGTGNVPDTQYLQNIFDTLKEWCSAKTSKTKYTLLYGGSVTGENIQQFYQVENIDGFLIGGSSLDFQKLKKIVS